MTGDPDRPGDWAAPGSTTPPPGWSAEQPAPHPDASSWGTPYAAPPPPRPGIVPLRPLGVGELLDGAFAAIRRYPRATLGLAAAVMLVVTAVEVLTQWWLLSGIQPPARERHAVRRGRLRRPGREPRGSSASWSEWAPRCCSPA